VQCGFDDGGPNGPAIKRLLEREFGVVYSLWGIYDLLHRLRYSSFCPRPQREKAEWFCTALTVTLLATVVTDAREDTFSVFMGDNNALINGGVPGYNGTWYFYPNTKWWNQWFNTGQ